MNEPRRSAVSPTLTVLFRYAACAAAALGSTFVVAPTDLNAAENPAVRTSSLSWVRLHETDDGISTPALANAIEARLSRKVFVSAADADLSVERHVDRPKRQAPFKAVVTVRSRDGRLLGTRELVSDGPNCETLSEQLVIVLSVMIDPDAALERVPREPIPEEPKEQVETNAQRDREPPSTVSRVRLAYGSLGLCPLNWRVRHELRACALAHLGVFHAEGSGFDRVSNADAMLVAGAIVAAVLP